MKRLTVFISVVILLVTVKNARADKDIPTDNG